MRPEESRSAVVSPSRACAQLERARRGPAAACTLRAWSGLRCRSAFARKRQLARECGTLSPVSQLDQAGEPDTRRRV